MRSSRSLPSLSRCLHLAVCLALATMPAQASSGQPARDLSELSIEALMNLKVTSVAKERQSLAESAAAIYVMTQDDIRRSGATSIPELLRSVPGLQVARSSSDGWAITCRGFNGEFANKMLVLLDGRTVYDPLFSGVLWDAQDTVLEDVDRIEIIRGTGASVWGANAVNGVVNIITKTARETRGGLLSGVAGNEDRAIGSLRYGGSLGEAGSYRAYGKYFNRGSFIDPSGRDANDSWDALRTGFRIDQELAGGSGLTLQGDAYRGHSGETEETTMLAPPFTTSVDDRASVAGANLLGRWQHAFSPTSDLKLQAYVDRTDRQEILLGERRDTYDVDLQHHMALGTRQEVIWGAAYRYSGSRFRNSFTISLDPDHRADHVASAFVEDLVRLADGRWHLTLGSKFEHNDYTGFEIQPTARALFKIDDRHTAWAAVSRAVRTPSQAERFLRFNISAFPTGPGQVGVVSLFGDSDSRSEDLIAYEIGYRARLTPRTSLDVTAFSYDYRRLRTIEQNPSFFEATPSPPHLVIPERFENNADGDAYGLEIAGNWSPTERLKLSGWYAFFELQFHPEPSSTDNQGIEGDSPKHEASLHAALDLPRHLALDTALFYVDRLPNQDIESYLRADARLAWHPSPRLEASLGGQDLFQPHHRESATPDSPHLPGQVKRSYDVRFAWRF